MDAPDEGPNKPAVAYLVMQAMLHPAYFTHPPAERFYRDLVVTGHDRIPTSWRFPLEQAEVLARVLDRKPQVKWKLVGHG